MRSWIIAAAISLGLAGSVAAAGDLPAPPDKAPYYPLGVSYAGQALEAYNYLVLTEAPAQGYRTAVWLVIVFKTPQAVAGGTIARVAFLESLDCEGRRDRRTVEIVYDPDGKPDAAASGERPWTEASANGLQGDVMRLGCGEVSPRGEPLPDIAAVLKDAAARGSSTAR